MSDIPIRNGLKHRDALLPLLFNFALQYAIMRVQVNQDALKLNGTHHLVVYADDNIFGRNVHTIENNPEALVGASKEISLEVNVDNTKYMAMSCDQNSRQCHNMKNDNSSFAKTEVLKYLGTNLANRNSTQEEIKSRVKSGNAGCHLVQNHLSSSLLSKYIKIYAEPLLCLLFCMGVKLSRSYLGRNVG